MLKRGIRGHDVLASGLSKISKKMEKENIEYVQLVLEKSIDGFGFGNYTREYAEKIKNELGTRKIAVLGSYINPSNPDEAALEYDKARTLEKIKYASVLNPIVVGTETGRYKEGETHTEAAYQRVLSTVKYLVSEAEKYGVCIGIEGVHLFVIDTPEIMKRLIDDVGSPALKVIFDPINLLNAQNYQRQDEIIEKTFDLLYDRLVCVHVKDFTLVNGEFRNMRVGGEGGMLNFPLIIKKMKEYGLDLPFITEEISDEAALAVFEKLEALL